jgi:hypothetical protein
MADVWPWVPDPEPASDCPSEPEPASAASVKFPPVPAPDASVAAPPFPDESAPSAPEPVPSVMLPSVPAPDAPPFAELPHPAIVDTHINATQAAANTRIFRFFLVLFSSILILFTFSSLFPRRASLFQVSGFPRLFHVIRLIPCSEFPGFPGRFTPKTRFFQILKVISSTLLPSKINNSFF